MTPHSNSPRFLAAVLPLVLLATACGKTPDETNQTPAPTPIAAEKFSEEYALALCTRSQTCGNLAPYLVEQCKAEATERIRPDDVRKAVAAGRIVYDADLARQCIDGIQNTACLQNDISDQVQATCYAALKGTVQKGAECSFLFECAAGLCGGSESNTCPATCPTADEVLTEGQECSLFRGPRCDARAGLRCSGGLCVKPADQGASCIDNFGCKSGLLCVEDKCSPLAKEGSACSEDASCAEGLFCQDGHCAVRKAEGKPCSVGPDEVDPALRGAQCQNGLVCKGAGLDFEGNPLAGSCVKPSAEGGPCQVGPENAFDFLTGCQIGLSCVNGACVVPPISGECPVSGCRPGAAYCAADNTCQPLAPNGAACEIPPQCASRNCVDGTCMPAVNYCHE